jgi:hypothetical protein
VKILGILILLSGMAAAQCSQASSGTNCNSPLDVSGSTASQSSVGLTDNGAAPPQPAASQYWLSISNGTIRLSANGQPYTLPGMPTNYVLVSQPGTAYSEQIAAGTDFYSPALTQIDMTLPQQVRLVVYANTSCTQCTVQAQFYQGGNWTNLTDSIAPANHSVTATAWAPLPSGANGDYPIRLVLANSTTSSFTVYVHSVMLQFK